MANGRGYLGKISAIVSANTGDYVRKLDDSAKRTAAFARTIQSDLTRASREASRSIDAILTPLQRFERAIQNAASARLKFRGVDVAVRTIEDLRRSLAALDSDQEKEFAVRVSGLRNITELKNVLTDIREEDIDLVVACTLNKLKENLRRFYSNHAGLDAVINDGTKSKRRRVYTEGHKVYVMNYEKLWHDEDEIAALVAGQRVLWVLDEGHKVITDNGQNKSRQALDRLTRKTTATIWPMSATVVGGNPLRYRDVFSLDGHPSRNPLSTKTDFINRYADQVSQIPMITPRGRSYTYIAYDWNLAALQEVRHRVGDRTMAVRKTDPGVREQFKGMETVPVMVQPTAGTRSLLEGITDMARGARDLGEGLAPYYLLARIACINPEALRSSSSPQAKDLVNSFPDLIRAEHSTKIEILNDVLESIQQAQDKAVVFCHWTELGLLPLARHITVPHVLHYGVGQSAKESQEAQDRFKTDPAITAFLSSDAGTHGLNLQEARYVINVDPTYSYDDLAQRNARIDRADSHLDGLTAYVLITEDSVEERVWETCQERRRLAAAVQGTSEELSYGQHDRALRDESKNLQWLLFGEDQ